MIKINAIVIAAAMVAVPATAANLLTNGSFEQPGGDNVRDQFTASYVPGWTYSSNGTGFDIYEDDGEDGLAAADGTHYVSFGHSGTYGGSLSQTVILTGSGSYELALPTAEQQGADPTQQFTVTIAPDFGSFVSFTIDNLTDTFTPTTHDFFGSGDTTITITDSTPAGGGGGSNLALDNVSLIDLKAGGTVPEPTSRALLVVGFGVVGALARQRRGAVIAA